MHNNLRQTFGKEERLYSKKQISRLFAEGNSFYKYPFKVICLRETSDKPELPKILISVSKRNFKKAVERNKIKRLIREAYRKNKKILIDSKLTERNLMLLALIYTGKTILSYAGLERKIILILQRLIEQDE